MSILIRVVSHFWIILGLICAAYNLGSFNYFCHEERNEEKAAAYCLNTIVITMVGIAVSIGTNHFFALFTFIIIHFLCLWNISKSFLYIR